MGREALHTLARPSVPGLRQAMTNSTSFSKNINTLMITFKKIKIIILKTAMIIKWNKTMGILMSELIISEIKLFF